MESQPMTPPETTPETLAKNDVYIAEVGLANAKNQTQHVAAVTALMDANDKLALIQGRPGSAGQLADPESIPSVQEFLSGCDEDFGALMSALPQESGARKKIPLFSGVLKYFPAALVGVAKVSMMGNDKHNPGQPLHHSRGKSADHADCILRHLVETSEEEGFDEHGIPSVAYVAWRALALCQEWYEKHDNAPLAPGARPATIPVDYDGNDLG